MAIHRSARLAGRAATASLRLLALCALAALLVANRASIAAELSDVAAGDLSIQQQRRSIEREDEARRALEARPDVRLQSSEPASADASRARLPNDEVPCFRIDRLAFTGDAEGRFKPFEAAAAGNDMGDAPVGRCIGPSGITIIAKRIQNALLSAGYVTSRVLVAPQDLSSGVLTLEFAPGRIRRVRLAAGTTERATLWNAVPMRAGDVLNLRDVEQALENLKRVPTAEVDIRIEAAAGPGESDLVISYTQAMPIRLSASLDDAGTDATGRVQAATTLSYDNALTLNDLFYVTLNRDLQKPSHAGGTEAGTVHYSLPFGFWTVGATYSRNRYHRTVAGPYEDTIYSGNNATTEFKLSRLVYRDAARKSTVSLRAFQRRLSNYADDTEIDVQRRVAGGWIADIDHREYIGAATLGANLSHRKGTGAFGALRAPEHDAGEGSARAATTATDVSFNAPLAVSGERRLRYAGRWRAQWNHAPLTPLDRFAIGGRYTVRGFDGETSLAGDRGWMLRNELLVSVAPAVDGYVGIDCAHVSNRGTEISIGHALAGAVVGLRGGLRSLSFDFFVGRPIHKPAAFTTAGLSAGFDLNYSF